MSKYMKTMYKPCTICDLKPNDGHKSFYGKAKVYRHSDGTEYLTSYNTFVACKMPDGTIKRHWDGYSRTTARHIKAFCNLNSKEFYSLEYSKPVFPLLYESV